jgi:hypothetical protein
LILQKVNHLFSQLYLNNLKGEAKLNTKVTNMIIEGVIDIAVKVIKDWLKGKK